MPLRIRNKIVDCDGVRVGEIGIPLGNSVGFREPSAVDENHIAVAAKGLVMLAIRNGSLRLREYPEQCWPCL